MEELGFDHAWTYDHLAWRSLRDSPWFGAVPFLTAGALSTERIRLGTLVASPNFRHPVPFARELVTLDDVSGGRFTLGIGAGRVRLGRRHPRTGPVVPERARRAVRRVPRPARPVAAPTRDVVPGEVLCRRSRPAPIPGCVQEPRLPFAVAATGRRGMALAATLTAGLGDHR